MTMSMCDNLTVSVNSVSVNSVCVTAVCVTAVCVTAVCVTAVCVYLGTFCPPYPLWIRSEIHD